MCGRYFIGEDFEEAMQTAPELRSLTIKDVAAGARMGERQADRQRPRDFCSAVTTSAPKAEDWSDLLRPRDIHPADTAPVLAADGGHLILKAQRWGYPSREKGLVINARRESARTLRLFSNGIEHHRIALPSTGFYEWNSSGEKYTFRHPARRLLYLAGFCDLFEGEERFVILTGAAGPTMTPVHDRQPLTLEGSDLTAWLTDSRRLDEFLEGTMSDFRRETAYEQLSLF